MNQKQFEIWEKQRRKEYEIELDKLQGSFASRGLAFSGMRNKAEADLKEKYDAEIEIARLGIGDDTEKGSGRIGILNQGKNNTFSEAIDWQKWGAIGTFASIFVSYWISTKDFVHALLVLLILFWFVGIPMIYSKSEKLSLKDTVVLLISWIGVQLLILALFGGDPCSISFLENLNFCI